MIPNETLSKNIEAIIKQASEEYEVRVDAKTKPSYVAFLQRQIEAHPDYVFNYQERRMRGRLCYDLLSDKLFIFSVLIGCTAITHPYSERGTSEGVVLLGADEPERESVEDDRGLVLLRARQKGRNLWDDMKLYKLFERRNSRRRTNLQVGPTPTYVELVDEVCRDPSVTRYWGRQISYENDIKQHIRRVGLKRNGNGQSPIFDGV